jgi:hypothetical protein
MKDALFSRAAWNTHGERMYYLQLQKKQGDGEWEKVINVVDNPLRP